MKNVVSFAAAFLLFITPVRASAMAETAKSVCVLNPVTNEVVFEKNMNEKHSMASTTKIMTAVIAIEKCGLDEIVTVSEDAAAQEGSSAYITAGSKMYMSDLLKGLMLNSGNDAAAAIAEHISGDFGGFAELMNKKAKEIGALNTRFSNPSGLEDAEHYSTAADMALIAGYAMKIPKFREIVSLRTASATPLNSDETLYFTNHNKLLTSYEGANGVKTGFTKTAGRCLVSSARRNNMGFIAVTLNDPNDWDDHKELMDYAFSLYENKAAVKEGDTIKRMSIDGKSCRMIAAESFNVPVRKDRDLPIYVITHISNNITAPINKGEKVGYVEILYNNKSIGSVDIISKEEILSDGKMTIKNDFFDKIMSCLKKILI